MSGQISPIDSPAKTTSNNEKSSVNACLPCRKVKMKCHISENNTICDRCTRKSFQCIFEKHRRGRKAALRHGHSSLRRPVDDRLAKDEVAELETTVSVPRNQLLNASSENISLNQQENPHSDFWVLLEGFRPSGLLNKQAMIGKLSLENITHGHYESDAVAKSDETYHIPADDPIRLGIVNSTIAASLFANFMRDLHPYICQFDPTLHTFHYIQRKSAFLLTAILSASAKAFNPSVHHSLQTHAEDLFTKCFRTGKKSPEIIQAILILTYWKEPDDTRAWLSTGYVIRMCMELGWHKLAAKSQQDQEAMGELRRREARSVERTWLLLFVYDRSLSLQTGSPSMIPRNGLIESAHNWYNDPLSTSQDRMLCALVTLRMIGSEIFDLLNPHRSSCRSTLLDRTDGLMKVLLNDIQKWHSHWSSVPEMGNHLYQFFVSFYGTNLRLLFSLFPLHASLTSGLPEELIDKQSMLISYTSAVEMLQLLVQPAFSPLLYFVQDSVHIMVAYAAIFLVKLLLSIPQSIRSEIESPAIDAVRKAADMFNHHSAPPNSGCGLQAKFLANVLRVFQKAQESRHGRGVQLSQHSGQQQGHQRNTDISGNNIAGLDDINAEFGNQDGAPNSIYMTQDPTAPGGGLAACGDAFGLQDFAFADDEIWASLFADAGFSINEGVFLPYGDDELGVMGSLT